MEVDKNTIMTLRPHHIVCMRHFIGKGYSEPFVANMRRVIASLTPDTLVRITLAADMICTECPHRKENLCDTQEKVMRMDAYAAAFFEVKDGDTVLYARLLDKLDGYVSRENALPAACRGCEWYELCLSMHED